jgi:hypothetical protein
MNNARDSVTDENQSASPQATSIPTATVAPEIGTTAPAKRGRPATYGDMPMSGAQRQSRSRYRERQMLAQAIDALRIMTQYYVTDENTLTAILEGKYHLAAALDRIVKADENGPAWIAAYSRMADICRRPPGY